MPTPTPHAVAEFQGLYGPFTVSELVLQKIWLRGDFDPGRAVLADGRKLAVLAPGSWNLLEGPDFRGARLRIAGREVTGDVEVHFHASDWKAHGHEANPAYAGVVLHVVLFAPERSDRPVRRRDGSEIPTLVLLPLLHRDIEEYAADDALETVTARDAWRPFAELASKPAEELRLLLREKAVARWRQKTRFASLRAEKLGWSVAAHQTALEILGYRRNRAAMLALAARHSLAEWAAADAARIGQWFDEDRALWQLHGVRPANHPLARLRQYAAWTRACPDWPERLVALTANLPAAIDAPAESTARVRRELRLSHWRKNLAAQLAGSAVSGTRWDTVVCDGLLPLAAARTGRDLFALWFSWPLGDVPDGVRRALTRLGIAGGRARPLCHGFGQGLLGWLMSHETDASA